MPSMSSPLTVLSALLTRCPAARHRRQRGGLQEQRTARMQQRAMLCVAVLVLTIGGLLRLSAEAAWEDDRNITIGGLLRLSAETAWGDRNILYPEEILFQGQSIVSLNCRFRLTMQGDGNLVLYEGAPGSDRPLWASHTSIQPSFGFTTMQHDGNLVLRHGGWGNAVWSTNTWGWSGAYLVMQDDGNLVVYNADGAPLWASDTVVGGNFAPSTCPPASTTGWQPNFNRLGGDYTSYDLPGDDASDYDFPMKSETCAYWCSQDSRCQAYTYVPPGVQGSGAKCWLKDQVPPLSYAPGLVSGYVYRR